jgi:hypothetical protein
MREEKTHQATRVIEDENRMGDISLKDPDCTK